LWTCGYRPEVIIVLVLALSATAVALALAYLLPPAASIRALRKRVTDCEALTEQLDARIARHLKRYRSLEGHVYGSMDGDDDDEPEQAAPGGHNPAHTPEPGTLALIPEDFPEDAFQAAVAQRRRLPNG
jgi:hypothetical protein